MMVKVKKIYEDANIPTYDHPESAGATLYAYIDEEDIWMQGEVVVAPGATWRFETGVALEIPMGYYGELHTVKNYFVTVGSPIVDSYNIGQIIVQLRNVSDGYLKVYNGEPIATIVFKRYEMANFVETEELRESERSKS